MTILKNPLVITGTPRAGKTCIARLIADLPEFSYVSEPIAIWNEGQDYSQNDRRDSTDADDKVRSTIIQNCQKAIHSNPDGRYLDDLSYHAIRIPFLDAVLPNVQIVHVVRDPLICIPEMIYGWTYQDSVAKAVSRRRKNIRLRTLGPLLWRFTKNYIRSRVNSHRSSWGPMPPGLREIVKTQPPHLVAAHQWQQINQIAYDDLNQLPADRWMRIRFEEMLENPESTAQRIAKFTEVEEPQAFIQKTLEVIDRNHLFEKKVFPTPEQEVEINAVVGKLRADLGY